MGAISVRLAYVMCRLSLFLSLFSLVTQRIREKQFIVKGRERQR